MTKIIGYVARHPTKPARLIANFGNVLRYQNQFISGCVVATPLIELSDEVQQALAAHDQLVAALTLAKEFEQHAGGTHLPAKAWFTLHETIDAALAAAGAP